MWRIRTVLGHDVLPLSVTAARSSRWFRLQILVLTSVLLMVTGRAFAQEPVIGPFTLQDLAANDNRTSCSQSVPYFCATAAPAVPMAGSWQLVLLALALLTVNLATLPRRLRPSVLILAVVGLSAMHGDTVLSANLDRRTPKPLYDVRTCQNNPIPHTHRIFDGRERELTQQEKDKINASWDGAIALNGWTAVRTDDPTLIFDCHGLTFLGSNLALTAWIDSDMGAVDPNGAVEMLLRDNFVALGQNAPKQVDDIVIYRKANGIAEHSAIVKSVDAQGHVLEVASKWGLCGIYRHRPGDCPYAQNLSYYRRTC